MRNRFLIGTRTSQLAQVQTRSVLLSLRSLYPEKTFDLAPILTDGDKRSADSRKSMVSQCGAFVKELQDALLQKQVDLVVHSLKDLPVESVPGLVIAAVTSREDPRDVLVSWSGKLDEMPVNSVIGTGSPRRTAQVLSYRKDLRVKKIKGNIDTRISRVREGRYDGIVIAAAGLIRLGWEKFITEYLPAEHFLPEPGQGALAIETRLDDSEIMDMVQVLNDRNTSICVTAERNLCRELSADCDTPMGALGCINDRILTLQGMAPGPDGSVYAQEGGSTDYPAEVACRLAQKLWSLGAYPPGQGKI